MWEQCPKQQEGRGQSSDFNSEEPVNESDQGQTQHSDHRANLQQQGRSKAKPGSQTSTSRSDSQRWEIRQSHSCYTVLLWHGQRQH